ncbi:Excitatory amino acid transporter 3 [Liparis tanakae]|uniref:Amino acid transporter n=1 Tax=Liparis tanakae TaxID=230148 RepID=A0A4Z2EFB3_9TELE|nr:Excitatory amino acid transporter 3 [Liparis tanakae]
MVCSFRTAGLPSRGAATTYVVQSMLDLSARETCLLVVIEYLLDRCNSVINVLSHCIGVALVDRAAKRDLQDGEELEMERYVLMGSCSVLLLFNPVHLQTT